MTTMTLRNQFAAIGCLAAWFTLASDCRAGELKVATDFPGGSGKVEVINQLTRTIRMQPTSHRERGWVCWWYIKVTGITPGETIAIDLGDAPWATPDQAAFSTDNRTWTHTGRGQRTGKRIVYRQLVNASAAWFAWGPPFVPADAQSLVNESAKNDHAEAIELCRTRADRPVPALRIQQFNPDIDDDVRYGIWIQARQHAWESGSSWVCRGMVEWLVSDDPRAEALRKKSRITIVPVMDIDNVAIGAGGKNQVPHDHNRDWSDEPHWKAVATAIRQIRSLDEQGRFDLFIDLHNPGASSQNPFFFLTPRKLLTETGVRNLDHFLAAAQTEMTGPLAYRGETHESGAKYDKRWKYISKNWVSFNTSEHVVALTLETAWNTPFSTTSGYRTVGKQLGLAVERYLRVNPRGLLAP